MLDTTVRNHGLFCIKDEEVEGCKQLFNIEVTHPHDPDSVDGGAGTYDYHQWFVLGHAASLDYPDCIVMCTTEGFLRRTYKNGQVTCDVPEYDYEEPWHGKCW